MSDFFRIIVFNQLQVSNIMARKQKKIDEFQMRALDEMFRRVGFEGYDEEFAQQPYWFTKREWTLEEDVAFTKWFIDEYSKTFREPKYIAKEVAGWFIFNYGWKTKKMYQLDDKHRR
jgi:hypothetical protein